MAGRGRRRLVAVAALVVLAGAAALASHAPRVPWFADPTAAAVRTAVLPVADAGFAFLSGPLERTTEAIGERPGRSPITGPLGTVLGLAALVPLLLLIGRIQREAVPIGAPWRGERPGSPRAPPVGR